MQKKPNGLDSDLTKRLIKYLSRANVAVFRATGGRVLGRFPGGNGSVPVCVLTHTGRKSGQVRRRTPLVHLTDDDREIVVASQAGRPHDPAWYLNITADPHVHLLTRRGSRPMRARTADPEERARLWPRLVEHYPDFANYQSWCPREIPVVVLEPQ